jgi:hypothetical protein
MAIDGSSAIAPAPLSMASSMAPSFRYTLAARTCTVSLSVS